MEGYKSKPRSLPPPQTDQRTVGLAAAENGAREGIESLVTYVNGVDRSVEGEWVRESRLYVVGTGVDGPWKGLKARILGLSMREGLEKGFRRGEGR